MYIGTHDKGRRRRNEQTSKRDEGHVLTTDTNTSARTRARYVCNVHCFAQIQWFCWFATRSFGVLLCVLAFRTFFPPYENLAVRLTTRVPYYAKIECSSL